MPQLIFYIEGGYPQVYDLLEDKTSIGREKDNDIALKVSPVSVRHAEIIVKEGEDVQLIDLDSFNGTTLNGKPIKKGVLKDGDQIKFGSVFAIFRDHSEDTPKSAPPKGGVTDIKKETQGLKRKSEIERNNLLLLRNEIEIARQRRNDFQAGMKDVETWEKKRADFQRVEKKSKENLERSLKEKVGLEKDLAALTKELKRTKDDLQKNQDDFKKAELVIKEAKAIKTEIGQWEDKLKSRKQAHEELELEIAKQKKAQSELNQKFSEKEKAYEKLGKDISDRKSSLEQLKQSIAASEKRTDELAKQSKQNDELCKITGEKLSKMKATFQQSHDDFTKTQELQQSLKKESVSISQLISEKTTILKGLKEKIYSKNFGSDDGSACPPLRVINPELRSLVHYFHHGAGTPDGDRVLPFGYFGFAACTKGSVHREADSILSVGDPALVLISGDLDQDRELLESVSREMPDSKLLVCLREGQLEATTKGKSAGAISKMVAKFFGPPISGVVSIDPGDTKLLEKWEVKIPHLNLPLPYPVDILEWNLSAPIAKRSFGVFVNGDGYDSNSPLHRARIELINRLVSETKTTVTLHDKDSLVGSALKIPADRLVKPANPLPYSDCLELMGQHHFVTGFGKNLAGGDTVGDAILARTVFLGADSSNATEELLFPDTCITTDNFDDALNKAKSILTDRSGFLESVEKSESLAAQLISFETVNGRLSEFIQSA